MRKNKTTRLEFLAAQRAADIVRQNTGIRAGQRKNTGAKKLHFRAIDSEISEDGILRLVASTDAPVRMGNFREILRHGAERVDTNGATALLINHDPDQIAGPIRSIDIQERQSVLEVEVLESARLQSGLTVREAVRTGALRGVSISYDYDFRVDAEWDAESRTVTVNSWRFMEASLTPIPADVGAGVRACPFDTEPTKPDTIPEPGARAHQQKENSMNFDAWLKARGVLLAKLSDDQQAKARAIFDAGGELPDDFAPEARSAEPAPAPAAAPAPAPTDAAGDEAARAAEMAELRRAAVGNALRSQALEHGIDPAGFNFDAYDDEATGSRALMAHFAGQRATTPPAGGVASVTEDQADKLSRAANNYLASRASSQFVSAEDMQGNPLAGRSMRHAAVIWGRKMGVRGIDDWSKQDQAHFAIGDYRNMSPMARKAANIISSTFPAFVNLDAVTKIVAAGFEQHGRAVNYSVWTERNLVPDFKNYYIGGLGTGNLQETAENTAFPELLKSEHVYQSAVKMWGGTLSLTVQALQNDDTRQFERSLRMAGAIAQKTINRRAYERLVSATWATPNVTTGAGIDYSTADASYGARQNLDKALAGMANKEGADGNPLGGIARYLLCAPALAGQARGITGGVAPGQATTQQAQSGDIIVVPSPWLTSDAISGNSTGSDDYYLVADPFEATGMTVSFIEGMESPIVQEYDAGATAALNWKIYLPFEADRVTGNNQSGTSIVAGIQKGTKA